MLLLGLFYEGFKLVRGLELLYHITTGSGVVWQLTWTSKMVRLDLPNMELAVTQQSVTQILSRQASDSLQFCAGHGSISKNKGL